MVEPQRSPPVTYFLPQRPPPVTYFLQRDQASETSEGQLIPNGSGWEGWFANIATGTVACDQQHWGHLGLWEMQNLKLQAGTLNHGVDLSNPHDADALVEDWCRW